MTDLASASRANCPARHRVAAMGVAVLTVVLAVLGAAAMSESTVRGDQTVRFDGAGDAAHISLIGDSTLTGVRWYSDYGALERFNFVFSAESCRRTIEQSCISREGYRSANAVMAMRSLDGELGEIVVVMSGYNDPVWTIDEAIAAVTGEARSQGVDHVVWLSLRTSDDVDYSDPQEQSSINTFRAYNEQLFAAAEDSDGFLQVADWATYSNGASGWFEGDGVHLTPTGVDAVTTFIAGTVERVLAGENVSPAAAPWTVLVPGAEGDVVADVQQAVIAADIELPGGADGVYGNDTMAAVAEFQRRTDGLLVTGAVDVATARALGVHGEPLPGEPSPPSAPSPAPGPPAADDPAARTQPAVAAGIEDRTAAPDERTLPSPALWLAGIAVGAAVLAGAAVLRHRYVAARRAQRRWARVHPATSPHRSVADLRRAGQLPGIVHSDVGHADVDRTDVDRGVGDHAVVDRSVDDPALR